MENEISELKILPEVIWLLSQGSSLGQLPLLPPLFPTTREPHRSPPKARRLFWMSKRLNIREISDSDAIQAGPGEMYRVQIHGDEGMEVIAGTGKNVRKVRT